MKHFKDIFRTFFTLALLFTSFHATAQQQADAMDSVEVSLITCAPHQEIYSLYGHSAIRWHDFSSHPQDIAFNYGVFDFRRPHFVLRFTFGLTDYELGAYPFSAFCAEYAKRGSQVIEQVLNLNNAEKRRLRDALTENLRPENRVYRYNFFYNNCSTKPRDIIEQILDGQLQYDERPDYQPTFREMVHEHTSNHPWAAFGNDMLLGLKADLKTSRQEQEFLPENLMYDFSHARILNDNRALVKETRIPVKAGVQTVKHGVPFTPTQCAVFLLLICLSVSFCEYRRKRTFKWWDLALMLATSIPGLVLTAMIFSQHPTTSLNLQLLLLNPLPLFFLPSVIQRRPTHWWKLSLFLTILFLHGAIWQDYAEGMEIVALCLFTRIWSNLKYAKQQ